MSFEQRLVADIRSFFEEFNVTLGNLEKPDYVFVRDFYSCALMELEVDTDNVRRASHMIDGMDGEVDITGDLNLVAAINHTFRFLHFGLFDLLSPGDNHRRTLNLIAQVMEFMNHADDLMCKLDFEKYENFKLQLTSDIEEVEALKHRLSQIALEKDSLNQRKIELQNERARLKANLQTLNVDVSKMERISNESKSQLENARAVLTNSSAEVEKMRLSIEELQEAIVLADTLKSREEAKVISEREKVKFADKCLETTKLREHYGAILEVVKKKAANVQEMATLFGELRTHQDALTQVQKDLAERRLAKATGQKEETALKSEATALEEALHQLKRDVEALTEQLDTKQKEHSIKVAEVMEAVKSTEAASNVDKADFKALCDLANSQQQQLLRCVNEFESLFEDRIASLR